MTRIAAFSVALLALSGTAYADTEICQTINGRTKCVHATGNVSCTTINGETHCTQIDPDQTETPLPEITAPGVDIRRLGDKLHVRAGGTEIVVEQGSRP
ncbi:MAG: hypothetical protein H7Z12_04545 [Rhodospirillaceae bacterium]|nr:hypothetical protein [Rhodospirillales bacterium]